MFGQNPRRDDVPAARHAPSSTTAIADPLLSAGILVAFCAAFAFLVIQFARSSSATSDEVAHLPAGYAYARWGDYRLNPEHPPLLKALAALPLLWLGAWPPSLASTVPDDSPELAHVRAIWDRALEQIDVEWEFGHYVLYGVRDEAVERLGASHPLLIPTTARLQAKDFLNDADHLLFWGRMPTMLLGVLLAALVFLWARHLYGLAGGVLAIALFAFDPNFIAHGGLVTTDVGVSLFAFGAVYFLWRACRHLTAAWAGAMALVFGLAFASKYSAVQLLPIFALLLAGRILAAGEWPLGAGDRRLRTPAARTLGAAGLFVGALLAAYVMVWAAYGFRYSAASDPDAAARAEAAIAPLVTLAGAAPDTGGEGGARAPDAAPAVPPTYRQPGHLGIEDVVRRTASLQALLERWPNGVPPKLVEAGMGSTPIGAGGQLILAAMRHRLLPEAYLFGFAHARMKSLLRDSYLRGEYSSHGFRSYFLWTILLKTPVPALIAILAALAVAMRRRDPWPLGTAFLVVPAGVSLLFAVGSNLNIGHRHLLPMYPFLFVLCGGLSREWARLSPGGRRWVATAAIALIVTSSSVVFAPPWNPAVVYPHYLAYFNELAGGPRNGHESLVDSNLDWGQDLKGLRGWVDGQPIDAQHPLYLCYFGTADPRYYQIPHVNTPGCYQFEPMEPSIAPRPGSFIAISATKMQGMFFSPQQRAAWTELLRQSRPVGTVGYSIHLFRWWPPPPAKPSSG